MTNKKSIPGLALLLVGSSLLYAQQPTSAVTITGAMSNVMRKGQLYGTIALDTITNKTHLYGLGPAEYLSGEILVLDGHSFHSFIDGDGSITVEETFQLKAPFFGYTRIDTWTENPLPDSVQTIPQLEQYLDATTSQSKRPFFFKLSGVVEEAGVHVVNLPQGAEVNGPEDAHQGQKNERVSNRAVQILGFFSREHKAVFTHHDTYLHMHLITEDRKLMGHLDSLQMRNGGMVLSLPSD